MVKKIKDITKLRVAYMIDRNVYDLFAYKMLKDMIEGPGITYQDAQDIIITCKKLIKTASNVKRPCESSKQAALSKTE